MLYGSENSNKGSVSTWGGWGGEGNGRELRAEVWQKTAEFCKAIILQQKNLKKERNEVRKQEDWNRGVIKQKKWEPITIALK